MQVDVVGLDTPAGVTGARGGLATEFRRVYLGVDGKIPGGFSYRVEADFANNAVELPDVYLTYGRSEEHTSELQSLMRISYAVFCLQKTKTTIAETILYHS